MKTWRECVSTAGAACTYRTLPPVSRIFDHRERNSLVVKTNKSGSKLSFLDFESFAASVASVIDPSVSVSAAVGAKRFEGAVNDPQVASL